MNRPKRLTAFVALAAAAALALTGCASGGGSSEGGEVVYVDAVGSNPPHLNQELSTDVTTRLVGFSMMEPLVRMDGNYNLFPALATEWEMNEDATQVTFKLREGVKWHDGEPFTSADVKFNLEEVLPLHPLGAQLTAVQGEIETPDDYTVIVNLTSPFGAYVEAMSGHVVTPAHLYEGTDITTNPVNSAPVGTGPYQFGEFVEGTRIVVEKYDDYWGGATNIDKVVFQIMPDSNARVLALQSGEVDRISSGFLDAAQVDTLRQTGDYLLSRGSALPATQTLFFNTRSGPTADPAVRAALYQAIDRQAVADNVYYGMAKPSRGPIPAAIEWAASPNVDYNKTFKFDPEAAGKALDAAGYPADASGHRFDLTLRVPASLPAFVGTSEVVKSSLEAIGVSVNLLAEDLNVFVDQTYTQHNFDMAVMSFGAFEDPSLGVARLYVCNPNSNAFQNPTGMCDEELDAHFTAAATTADRAERAKHFEAMENRAIELMHTVPIVDDLSESIMSLDGWAGVEEFANITYFDWSKLRAA